MEWHKLKFCVFSLFVLCIKVIFSRLMIAVVNSLWGCPQNHVTGIYYRIQKHLLPVFHIHSSIFFNFVVLSLKCMYAFYGQLIVIIVIIRQRLYQICMIVFSIFAPFSLSLQKCFSYSCDLHSEVSPSLAPGRWRQHVSPTRLNILVNLCGAINQMTVIWGALSVKAWKLLKWG